MLESLPVFLATTWLMLAVPGPDFVLVTRSALTRGRRQTYYTIAGICAGLALLTVLTATGLAAVVASNPAVLKGLRLTGGAYLVLLGLLLLLSGLRAQQEKTEETTTADTRSPFMQGFLNNTLNPKALIFYLTFMPQFLVPGVAVLPQTLTMGILVVFSAAAWWTLYVSAVGRLRPFITRRSVRTTIDVGAGTALGGLGGVLIFGGL